MSNLPSLRRSGINVLSIWGQRLGGIIVALVVTPIITRHFGLELVGIWLLVSQFVQHLSLIELGLNSSLTRFLARYRADGDLKEASRYLSASVISLSFLGLLILLFSPLLAKTFVLMFNLSKVAVEQAYLLVLVALVYVAISLPLRTAKGMLSSLHRFERVAMWNVHVLVIRLLLVLICFQWFDPDLLMLGLITFAPMILGDLMMYRDGRHRNQDLLISHSLLSRRVFVQMFSITGSALVITLAGMMTRQTSPMLVGYQYGAAVVAVLALPLMIASAVTPILGVASRLIAPIASQLAASDSKNVLYGFTVIASRYVFSLALLVMVGSYYLGYPFFKIWLEGSKIDDDILYRMSSILFVIFAGIAFATPGFVMRSILISVGRHWQAAVAEILGAFIGIVVGIWLMIATNLGVVGMAVGISIAFVVRGAGFLMFRGANYFSVSYFRLMFDCIAKPVVIVILAIVSSQFGLAWKGYPQGMWMVGLVPFFIAFTIWVFGVWFWILETDHKRALIDKLSIY